MKSVCLAGVSVVLLSMPFLSIAQDQGRVAAPAGEREVHAVAQAAHSDEDGDRKVSANRIKPSLSENETALILPWFLNEFLQTINAGDGMENSVRDYVHRLSQGI
mgnify:CR=1 FL=1|jgi:hypothetical protein